MTTRLFALVTAVAALAGAGCAVLSLVLLPFELLFDLLGGIVGGVTDAVDAVVEVTPHEGAAPRPQWRTAPDGRMALAFPDVDPASRFTVRIETKGNDPVSWTWPDDAGGSAPVDGRLRVPLVLTATPHDGGTR